MSSQHPNDALVREFLLLWERRDVEGLVAACAEDVVWHHRPLPPAEGHDGIRAFAEQFADVPGGPYEILLQVADDTAVFNERLDHVTFGGRLAQLRSCGVFEIEDGRIRAWRDYYDTASLGPVDDDGPAGAPGI